MSEVLKVLRTNEELQEVIDYLNDPDRVYTSYDCETTGLEKDALVVGFSVCCDIDLAYYVVRAYWDKEQQKLIWLDNEAKAKEIIELLKTKELVTQNGTVDFNWTEVNFGIQLRHKCHTDVMIMAHLLDENRPVGLKELGYAEFGADAKKEQEDMKASVIANGGVWEDKRGGNKEMYKADWEIMGLYGAKDAILTLKLFYLYVPKLFEQGLDKFFYEDESMPLFNTATYDLNTTGLRVDMEALKKLEGELTIEIAQLKEQVMTDIMPYVQEKYPGTTKKNMFNIGASQQMAWLLFIKLDLDWKKLTDKGRDLAKSLLGKAPYNPSGRSQFERVIRESVDEKGRPLKLEKYLKCDKNVLMNYKHRYDWIDKLLKHNQLTKLLNTYVVGLQERVRYGVIYPSFLQHGTTGGRYSSRNPNFQNLPRDDKRIKRCIISRPGKVFIGADYSQLEPRVFASMSQDERLMACFARGEDFYSVVGIPVFKKFECSSYKKDSNYFGADPDPKDPESIKRWARKLYPHLRQIAKNSALAVTYGTTAYRLSDMLRDDAGRNLTIDQCEQIIRDYFEEFPKVREFQLAMHKQAIEQGVVYNLYGRPRRIPQAKFIKAFGKVDAKELPYEFRTLLNLGVNHRVQSTAASIVNRAAIAFYCKLREHGIVDAKIVMQIHDELIVECREEDAVIVAQLLKDAMENAAVLPGVALKAEPKIARNLADLK